MKTLEPTSSSSEEEMFCSSDEEPPSQEKLQTNERTSNSESEESEYESSEEESDESGDLVPKSVVPVSGGSSKKSDSKRKKTADNVSQNEKGKRKCKSYDLKSKGLQLASSSRGGSTKKVDSKGKKTADNVSQNVKGKKKLKSHDLKSKTLQVASSSRSSLKAKGDGEISKRHRFPRLWSLKDEITLLISLHEFQLKEGRGVGPSSIELFCDLLKGRISFTERPSGDQVSKKMRDLKKKYFRTVKSFTAEHDLKMKEIADRVWKRKSSKIKSSKGKFPLLKIELRKLDLHDLEKELKSEEKAAALENKLKLRRIDNMKLTLKRLALEKEILKFYLEDFRKSDN